MKRRLWIIAFMLVAALLLTGLTRMRFNTEILDLFPSDLPDIGTLKLYQKNFQGRDQLVISLTAPSDWTDSNGRSEKLLEAARNLKAHFEGEKPAMFRRVLAEPPWAGFQPEAAELLAYYWLNQDPAEFQKLAERTAAPQRDQVIAESVERLASAVTPEEMGRAGYDPLGFLNLPGAGPWAKQSQQGDLFVSREGEMRLVFAYLPQKSGFSSYGEGKAWLANLHQGLDAWKSAHPEFTGLEVGLTGNPVFVSEISQSMMRDLSTSVSWTTVLIALLFYVVFRRVALLLILQLMLGLVLLVAFAAGGLMFGDINAISIGFAAILLGLVADYGLVLYQEISRFPGLPMAQMRDKVASSVWAASLTTATIFGTLYLSSFRGVSQLGALVAIGILAGGVIMLYLFLPLWVWHQNRWLREHRADPIHTLGRFSLPRRAALIVTGVVAIGIAAVLTLRGLPSIDGGTAVLEPRDSPAFQTIESIQKSFGGGAESIYLLYHAPTLEAALAKINASQPLLEAAQAEGKLVNYALPTGLLPNSAHQQANAPLAREMAGRREEILTSITTAGYEGAAVSLAQRVLEELAQLTAQSQFPIWPRNETSLWALEQVISRPTEAGGEFITLGSLQPVPGTSAETLRQSLPGVELLFTSWKYMGPSILGIVKKDMTKNLAIIGVVLVLALWIVFRRFSEVILSIGSLAFSMLLLLAVMSLAGLEWNLMNLMAIPLMLGTGIDHSIHLQIALQRHDGSLKETFKSIGLALLLCGVTNGIGFASLISSSSSGLTSMGIVCTIGVILSPMVSVFLLPAWWQVAHPDRVKEEPDVDGDGLHAQPEEGA